MLAIPPAVAAKLPHLPESPGVYIWRDRAGTPLYVGKAKRLRTRVRSYFNADTVAASIKTAALVAQVADVETIVVPSESHALVLEATLIKQHRPRFNIALRDDKSYPYIKVTLQEPFPRVLVTRRVVPDGARYFGPYTDVGAMRHALNVVKRIFTVRSCTWDMPKDMPERACLDHAIGRCQAPCVGLQTREDYRAMIDEVVAFLSGRTADVMRRVRERMEAASAALDFERAASLRDALHQLDRMEEPTEVMNVTGGDSDVIGYARDGDDAAVAILRIRSGKLLARDHRLLEHVEGESDASVLAAYLAASYLGVREGGGGELLLPFPVADQELLATSLGVRVAIPQRGSRRALADLAEQNARHLLEEFKLAALEADERAADPVYELAREIGLQKIPRALVCFDISTAQGTDTVGSCVWFENGRPRRSEYRKFRVKTVEGIDDFAAMAEVVTRYFRRRIEERNDVPDLVVIDGGKGQLGAAAAALSNLGLGELPLISLAKREEEIYVLGRSDPIRLSRRSPGLQLVQRARDEAHRVAVSFNRNRRKQRTITSELLKIPGVGPLRRRELLREFGSIQGILDAGVEQVAKLPRFSLKSAQKIVDALRAAAIPATTVIPRESGEPRA